MTELPHPTSMGKTSENPGMHLGSQLPAGRVKCIGPIFADLSTASAVSCAVTVQGRLCINTLTHVLCNVLGR